MVRNTKRIWNSWKILIRKISRVQVDIALTTIYILIIIPLAYVRIALRILFKNKSKKVLGKSYWKIKDPIIKVDEWAKKL